MRIYPQAGQCSGGTTKSCETECEKDNNDDDCDEEEEEGDEDEDEAVVMKAGATYEEMRLRVSSVMRVLSGR